MADNFAQFANDAQEATRCAYEAFQGLAETQVNTLQRLGAVQQSALKQTAEAANDQLQLIGRVRDPREFASAQADLAKRHGQRYVDSVKQAVDIIAEGWQEYGDRLEKGLNAATDQAQKAASPRKSA
jgi:phasin family protein